MLMHIRTKLFYFLVLFLSISLTVISLIHYSTIRESVINGVNNRLLTAAYFTKACLPDDYHDKIFDRNSVSKEQYIKIVDKYNKLCSKLGLEYVWSLIKINGRIYFTSGTSPSKDVTKDDYAHFFDLHSNPGAYKKTFDTMKIQYVHNDDKWGSIRAVLVPFRDVHGRPYLFGAAIKMSAFEHLSNEILVRYFAVSVVIILIFIFAGFYFAGTISRPILKITEFAQSITKGDLDKTIEVKGSIELKTLSACLTQMSHSIKEKIIALEEQKSELESFVYTVSHDLKTPLITIGGFSGLVKNNIENNNNDAAKEDLLKIVKAARKMHKLIEDLLQISRIGRIVGPFERVSIKDTAEYVLENFKNEIDNRKMKVIIKDNLPVVFAEKIRIEEMIQNLIENSLKFTAGKKDAFIEIGSRMEGEDQVIYVKDNGIGIDEKYAHKIFNIFERLDPSIPGTGVGLSIVKRIVEFHNGRIWVESDGPGKGATFLFTLPCKQV